MGNNKKKGGKNNASGSKKGSTSAGKGRVAENDDISKHIFHVGKGAAQYNTVRSALLTHIRKTYSGQLAQALWQEKDYDWRGNTFVSINVYKL